VVIAPTAYVSKKYYVLGNVNQKGVFVLDRPISIIEAIARARGFVSGAPSASQRNPLVQADLPRSFLIRRGAEGTFHRVAVDFEGLFLQGDLSQNIALEPDDYLFFPPVDLQEVYVLGEVPGRGIVPYSPEMTALGAIVARGGFTERAWRQKVLVVRGSLNRPQTFVVDAAAILSAKSADFPLKNRDIVYVHQKPWAIPQELLELAVTSFANSFISGLTYTHVGPFIKEPWIK
jgi:protein involved in polysaccharide export with SLBB domain